MIKLRSKQQRALPFCPPYIWYECCSICMDDTFVDDKFPIGLCERCASDYRTPKLREKDKKERLAYWQEECPDWEY
jgi:hypothetical protein